MPSNKEIQEVVNKLSLRVRELESQNESLQSRLNEAERSLDRVSLEVDRILSNLEEVEERVDDLEIRVNEEENDDTKEKVHRTREQLERKLSETNKRLTEIESRMDNDSDRGYPSSPIEHLSTLPEYVRKEEIDRKRLQRAVILYENFSNWSEYTSKGYVVKSKMVKVGLPEELEWSQVYRCMREFGMKTGERYSYIDSEKTGKAVIKWHEGERPS